MNVLILEGCRPAPLAHYLKALGVLRLVGAQLDPGARGAWGSGAFALHTAADEAALRRFFLEDWAPTPLVAPWNGGSGFHPKDNQAALAAIKGGGAARLAPYREAIAAAEGALRALKLTEKASGDDKQRLLERCRGCLPDAALPWLDAALVLTEGGAKYPPLLGTGGNDGRLEFTNNFMQRVVDLMDPATGAPTAAAAGWLDAALFGAAASGLQRGSPIGQFYPGAAGGPNASAAFDGDALINPWDFVLMLEGAALFAAAAVRRLGEAGPGVMAAPFTVRQAAVGYGSAADEDERQARAEMWMPLWDAPARAPSIAALMAEGRAQVGDRAARDGVDFARAIAGLGVDRGVAAFERYGFQMRQGRTYLAVPLGRWAVRREPDADLLLPIDGWLRRLRKAAADPQAPSSAGRALRQLERAILTLCQGGGPEAVQAVVIGLGACERALSRSRRWAAGAFLSPAPPLGSAWLDALGEATPELRISLALASVHGRFEAGGGGRTVPLREHLEPARLAAWRPGARAQLEEGAGPDVVWRDGDLVGSLGAILGRRLVLAARGGMPSLADRGARRVGLGDVAAFIDGRLDDARIEALLWGLILVDWPAITPRTLEAPGEEAAPGPLYGAMKLCLVASGADGAPIRAGGALARRALMGDGRGASALALRRLKASGLSPATLAVPAPPGEARRAAAALMIPLGEGAVGGLRWRILERSPSKRVGRDGEEGGPVDFGDPPIPPGQEAG